MLSVDGRSSHRRISVMSSQSNPASVVFRGAALALTILFFAVADGSAQNATKQDSTVSTGPFGQLTGRWSGRRRIRDTCSRTLQPLCEPGATSHTTCRAARTSNRSAFRLRIPGPLPEAHPSGRHIRDLAFSLMRLSAETTPRSS